MRGAPRPRARERCTLTPAQAPYGLVAADSQLNLQKLPWRLQVLVIVIVIVIVNAGFAERSREG